MRKVSRIAGMLLLLIAGLAAQTAMKADAATPEEAAIRA